MKTGLKSEINRRKKISNTMKKLGINRGSKNPMYGKPGAWTNKKRPDISGKNHHFYGIKRRNFGLSVRGKNNPNWKGRQYPFGLCIKATLKYKSWRTRVFQRDNYTCQDCGKTNCYIEVHHIKKFSIVLFEFLNKYPKLSIREDKEKLIKLSEKYKPFWNTSNGQTLCEDCHKLTSTYGTNLVYNNQKIK